VPLLTAGWVGPLAGGVGIGGLDVG
jgi:hypothetical protein